MTKTIKELKGVVKFLAPVPYWHTGKGDLVIVSLEQLQEAQKEFESALARAKIEERKKIEKKMRQLMDFKTAKRLANNIEIATGGKVCPVCGYDPLKQRKLIFMVLSTLSNKK